MWVLGSLVLAAFISPWLYQGGKHLAARAAAEDLPAVLEWLGAACGRAKFGRYFDRSMLISALVFMPFLYRRIRMLHCGPEAVSQCARLCWRERMLRIAIGVVISGVILWLAGALLVACGAFEMKERLPSVGTFFSKVLVPAAGASLLEEWLFRGVLLGLWLRYTRPVAACVGSSLLFAFLHFLQPPAGTVIGDPAHAFAGFRFFGEILLHFSDPRFFVADFISLLAVGLVLAWARVRTGSLWFGIGLHAGWIIAFKGFNLIHRNAESALRPWGVGDDLRSGIVPLIALALTAWVCGFVMRRYVR
jgi:membrane protease YdiL (CAAX protease family)